jgi:hypothetical protein
MSSLIHRLTLLLVAGLTATFVANATGQDARKPATPQPAPSQKTAGEKPGQSVAPPNGSPGNQESKPSPQSSATPVPRRVFTGRPGELEPEEEDRIDAIIDRFIQHDLGVRPDPKAVQEFQALGIEAIPALVRALNRTAPLAQKCPPAMIAKKLNSLLLRVQDPEVCDFVRREVGAGIRSGPNVAFLDSVRFNAMLRKRQLLSQPPTPTKSLFPAEPEKPTRSPGEKP